jgi:hypothetical protein
MRREIRMRKSMRMKLICVLALGALIVPSHVAQAGNFQQAKKNFCAKNLFAIAQYVKLDIFTSNATKGDSKNVATLNKNLKIFRDSAPDAKIRGLIDQLSKNIKSKTKNGVPPSVEDSGFNTIYSAILDTLMKGYVSKC